MAAEIAPVPAVESRQCARATCGSVFTPSPDDPDQESCSRYCRSMLRLERSAAPKTRPPERALMAGSELIGDRPTTRPASPPEPVAPTTRPRISLGPSHPDYGSTIGREPAPERVARPPRVYPTAFQETRTCERGECPKTFTVKADNRQKRFCSNSCARFAMHASRPKGSAQRPPVRFAPVEPALVAVAAAAPDDDLHSCRCLRHADERAAQKIPPLVLRIGALSFPSLPIEGRR